MNGEDEGDSSQPRVYHEKFIEDFPASGRYWLLKQELPVNIQRGVLMAERAGFEPANLWGLHAFQACALSQLRDLSVRRANYTIMKITGQKDKPIARMSLWLKSNTSSCFLNG